MITGEAIASLLLNEEVNDYDYYFTNMETTLAVAEYYIKQFNKLNPDCSIKLIVELDINRVKVIVKSAGVVSENIDEDVDKDVDKVIDEKEDTKLKYRPIFISSNAITLSNRIQLVVRFYGNPEEVHANYDYVHCCNYWLSKDHKLYLNTAALESLLSKNLYYQGSLYPVCSIIRMRKFLKKGWHINAGQILKMIFQVSELDLSNLNVLEEQLIGVDASYYLQVIYYFKTKIEKDPAFKITTPYLISIIDKIFG